MHKYFFRFQSATKELFQVGFGQVLGALGGLVGIRLITQVMTPSSYGELTLGMTFVLLVQQLIMGPIANGLARFFPVAQEKGSLKGYFRSARFLLIKASGITLILFFVVSLGLIITGNKNWIGLLSLTLLFALISSYNNILDSVQNAARQRVIVALHQGVGQWLRFLIAVGLIVSFESSSNYAMLGFLISAILIFISQLYFLNQKLVPAFGNVSVEDDKTNGNYWEHQLVHFALPFSTWGIFTWAQMSSDRWALQAFGSTTTVGLYSVLYQLGYYPITFITGVFIQFISPILYKRVGDALENQRVESAQRITNYLTYLSLVFVCILTIIAWTFRDLIFKILVAPDYQRISGLLPWLVLSGGLFASGQISAMTALNNNRPKILLKPKIVTSAMGVVFSFVGSYFFGINGVIGAGVIYAFCYFVWVYWLFRIKVK